MDTFVQVVLTIVIVIFVVRFSKVLKNLLVALCGLLDVICQFVGFPLALLAEIFAIPISGIWKPIAEKSPTAKISQRFPALGSPSSILILFICLFYILVNAVIISFMPANEGIFNSIFYNTTIGALVNMVLHGVSLSWIEMLSAGFSTFMSYVFISKLLESDEDINLFFSYIYHIVFFATASMLSAQLSGLFEILGNWGVTTYQNLSVIYNNLNLDLWGVLQMIGIGLALLVLAYIGLNLFLVTLRDLVANIGYGILAFLFVVAGYLLLVMILPDSWVSGSSGDGVAYLLLIGTFLYAEHTRANPDFGQASEKELDDMIGDDY